MAAWTSPNSRLSTCSSASCARSSRLRAMVSIISKPFGAAAMCCAIPRRRRSPDPNTTSGAEKGAGDRALFICARHLSRTCPLPHCGTGRMAWNLHVDAGCIRHRFEILREAHHRLGGSEHQIAVGSKRVREAAKNLLLRLLIEIDQHIAAEDYIEGAEFRIGIQKLD